MPWAPLSPIALLPLQVPPGAGVRPGGDTHKMRSARLIRTRFQEGPPHSGRRSSGQQQPPREPPRLPVQDPPGQNFRCFLAHNQEAQTLSASDRTSQPPWIVAPSLSHAALGKAKPTRGTPVRRGSGAHLVFWNQFRHVAVGPPRPDTLQQKTGKLIREHQA